MNGTRYDDLMKALKTETTIKGAFDDSLTAASKFMEINYTIRQVDKDLDICKSTIIELLKDHEIAATTLARLEVERRKVAASDENLTDFKVDARQRFAKIAEIRNSLVPIINDDEESYEEKVRETVRKINAERNDVLGDLENVRRNVKSLKTELDDIANDVKLEKMKNDDLRATLERKRSDAINRYMLLQSNKTLTISDELARSNYFDERKTDIKIERKNTFSG